MILKVVVSVIVAMIVGFGGGYIVASNMVTNNDDAESTKTTEHDNTPATNTEPAHSHAAMNHDHAKYEVSAEDAPKVTLTVEEDAMAGWNVTVNTEGFTFAPEAVNQENVLGQGHAHLYVDGEKVARLYGPSFHYDGVFDGTKTFSVTLNANNHGEYAVDGEVIQASQEVTHAPHN